MQSLAECVCVYILIEGSLDATVFILSQKVSLIFIEVIHIFFLCEARIYSLISLFPSQSSTEQCFDYFLSPSP